MNFDGTTDDALGQRVVVFKIVHRVLRVLCVSVSSVFKQTRRLRSCMTSSRAVGRCVRHRGHRDTEDTEEFRDFASTTLPTTDGRICCLAITAGAPRTARGLFFFALSDQPGGVTNLPRGAPRAFLGPQHRLASADMNGCEFPFLIPPAPPLLSGRIRH